MNRFAILFVLEVCLMGGMAMPAELGRGEVTTVTSGQSEEPCVWRSDISVHSLTILVSRLNAVTTWALKAFDSTCLEMNFGNADLCLWLKRRAAQAEGYPVFDPLVVHTCDVQEIIRHAFYVIVENFHLIEQFSNFVGNRYTLSDVTAFDDLYRLRNHLQCAKNQLSRMIGDSVLPTAVATIANAGDVTSDNQMNVRIAARMALEVDKTMVVIHLVSTHLSD